MLYKYIHIILLSIFKYIPVVNAYFGRFVFHFSSSLIVIYGMSGFTLIIFVPRQIVTTHDSHDNNMRI